jgi:hypothetical protein
MRSVPRLRRCLALLLAVVMAALAWPSGRAQAALVSTERVIDATTEAGERERVVAFLGRDDVVREMVALGIDPAEARARVATLSDAEIREIAGALDQLPAGQGAIGALIGAALLVFLVLLITDLLGLTDFYPFVRR